MFKVFEYDRDGNERYTELRYHEPDHFAYICGARAERTPAEPRS